MQNDMRDRLVEILLQKTCHYSDTPCDNECGVCDKIELYRSDIEKLADYLIANGVIVPPCKVGDTVWVDDFMWGLIPCKIDRPYHCICGEKGGCTFEMSFTDDDIGKTVFLNCSRVNADIIINETRDENA